MLAAYDFNPGTRQFTFVRRYAWFAGKMVGKKEDRLGTVQTGSRFTRCGEIDSGGVGGRTDSYQYDSSNARVWRNNRFFLRGVGGKVLAVYDFNPVTKTLAFVQRYAWFAGKMVGKKEDRLGTVLQQAGETGSRFYPYGEEWPAAPDEAPLEVSPQDVKQKLAAGEGIVLLDRREPLEHQIELAARIRCQRMAEPARRH